MNKNLSQNQPHRDDGETANPRSEAGPNAKVTGATSIRAATTEDLADLQSFLKPFVDAEYILPRSDEDLLTLIRHGFVAEHDNEIVGFAAIEIYSQKMAEVQSLAVAENVQGQGIGARLVEHCVQRATDQGVLELMAITASENLFRRVGFDYSLPNQKRALFVQTRARKEGSDE